MLGLQVCTTLCQEFFFHIKIFLFVSVFFFFSPRQAFFVALEPVVELVLVDQAGLKLRDPPASASQVLGLKVCAPLPGLPCLLHSVILLLLGSSCDAQHI